LKHIDDFTAKTSAIFENSDFPEVSDPDGQLYSGGFFSRDDNHRIDTIRNTAIDELAELQFDFDDDRLSEMLFRYRARNYPQTLNKQERDQWNLYRHNKFTDPATSHRTMNQLFAQIEDIQQAPDTIGTQLVVLEELLEYANSIKA
jgi:exodeoxyribonuclease-1